MIATSSTQQRNLLKGSLLAVLAGAAGGGLAALVVGATLRVQAWIWGPSILQGLPGDRPLLWCLLWIRRL